MPDYLTKFSCRLDTGSAANAERAVRRLAAYQRLIDTRRTDIDYPCFSVEADPAEDSPGGVWIHDGDGMGDPDHVITAVLHYAKLFDLRGRWGFSWSHDCSRPALDAFGGGACVLDVGSRTVIADLDCGGWLDDMIRAVMRFMIYSPTEAQMGQGGAPGPTRTVGSTATTPRSSPGANARSSACRPAWARTPTGSRSGTSRCHPAQICCPQPPTARQPTPCHEAIHRHRRAVALHRGLSVRSRAR